MATLTPELRREWIASRKRLLHVTGGLLVANGALGFLGPTLFEMNVRGTGDARGDFPHIVLTGLLVSSAGCKETGTVLVHSLNFNGVQAVGLQDPGFPEP